MWADERGGDIPRHRCLSSGWGEIGLTPATALTPFPWRVFTSSQFNTFPPFGRLSAPGRARVSRFYPGSAPFSRRYQSVLRAHGGSFHVSVSFFFFPFLFPSLWSRRSACGAGLSLPRAAWSRSCRRLRWSGARPGLSRLPASLTGLRVRDRRPPSLPSLCFLFVALCAHCVPP